MAQPVSDEALQLRKRARRRLVGAIALVALVVLVVPWFIDTTPPPPLKDVEIVIPPVPPVDRQFPAAAGSAASDAPDAAMPPEEPAGMAPSTSPGPEDAVAPKSSSADAPVVQPEPATLAPSGSTDTAMSKPRDKPADKRAERPVEKPREAPKPAPPTKPATAPGLPTKGFVVQLGAYADRDNAAQLLARVRALGLPGYVEPVKTPDGTKIRVRSGPFPTLAAAEAARARLGARQLGSGDLKVVQAGQ